MQQEDSEGFQTVTRRKSAKNINTKLKSNVASAKQILNQDSTKKKIEEAKEEILYSEYFSLTKETLEKLIDCKVSEILCFGLGHFGECSTSRYQLAFLLCLKDIYETKVKVHDPIFCKDECQLLQSYELEVLFDNSEGIHSLCNNGLTLVYMPHCPKQLTNNFLWCNFTEKLSNCILLSNSFENIIESNINQVLINSVYYIKKIQPYTQEYKLRNIFRFSDIFNDTSIHTFPLETLSNLPKEFWERGPKPQYKDAIEFITSQMIEKLSF